MDEETFTLLSDCLNHFDTWWQANDESQESANDLMKRLNAAIENYTESAVEKYLDAAQPAKPNIITSLTLVKLE